MSIYSHRDLLVWQKAMDMTVLIYELSSRFPTKETYGLVSQVTRAAASVPANIAEGKARATTKEYAHFLSVARGSLMEAETFLLLAIRLHYLKEEDAASVLTLIAEVGRMLNAIRTKLISSP